MVVVNANDADKVLDTQRFNEMLSSYHSGLNVETGEAYGQLDKISLKRKSTQIIELRKH
ncbi:MAG: cyclomaltodextrinase C-terminal domain-containing protein [Bacteroides cellulosilyticus]